MAYNWRREKALMERECDINVLVIVPGVRTLRVGDGGHLHKRSTCVLCGRR